MDGDKPSATQFEERSEGALAVIREACILALTDVDYQELVLTIDREVRGLGLDFVSMTLHRVLEEEARLFVGYIITGSFQFDRIEAKRPGVYRDWKRGEVHYRRDLSKDLEDLPPASLKKRESNLGISVRSTVNVPYKAGMLVVRSEHPEAFSDQEVAFLQKIGENLSGILPILE